MSIPVEELFNFKRNIDIIKKFFDDNLNMADNIKNILQTINTKYDCDISESTLRRYLHKLEQTKYIQKTKLGEKTYYYFKMGDDDI